MDIKELRAYFSVETKGICTETPTPGEVTVPEFRAFWMSLTDAEKEYYKSAQG